MTSIFIKMLISGWPFIREMFFGGKKVKDIVLDNKLSTFLLMLLVTSIFLNVVTLGKIYEIAVASRKVNVPPSAAAKVIEQLGAAQPAVKPKPQVVKTPTPAPTPPINNDSVHESTMRELRELYGDTP